MSAPFVEAIAVRAHEAIVIVGGVRVRWRIDPTKPAPTPNWRCDEHGTSHHPTCEHAAQAAAAIATQLLGLPAEVTQKKEGTP